MGQAKIFVTEFVNVAHKLSFRGQRIEHLLVHEGTFASQLLWNPMEILVVKVGRQKRLIVVIWGTIFLDGKNFDNFCHIRDLGRLIDADAN